MPKVTGPLFSLKARGQLGKALIFKRGGIVVNYFKPRNPNSAAQQAQREAFRNLYMAGLTQEQADLLYAAIDHLHDERYVQLAASDPFAQYLNQTRGDARYVKLSDLPVLSSGVYTPTATNVSNVSASVVNAEFHWTRLGDMVEVDGSIQIDPTATGAATVGLSLPIASNFSNSYDLNGNATSPAAGVIAGSVIADDANNRASVVVYSPDGANRYWRLYFRYKVIP